MLLGAGESCSEVFKQQEYLTVFKSVQSTQNEKKLKNHCCQTIYQHLKKNRQQNEPVSPNSKASSSSIAKKLLTV